MYTNYISENCDLTPVSCSFDDLWRWRLRRGCRKPHRKYHDGISIISSTPPGGESHGSHLVTSLPTAAANQSTPVFTAYVEISLCYKARTATFFRSSGVALATAGFYREATIFIKFEAIFSKKSRKLQCGNEYIQAGRIT